MQKELLMKKNCLAAGLFLLAAVLLAQHAYAQNVSDFEIIGNDDGSMTIINYKGMAKDIVIPDRIFNMPVTRIRGGAFSKKGLTSVTIPKTVSYIGDRAFSENQLASVVIPEPVEYIGNDAFNSNKLSEITIPKNVLTIGYGAFRNNNLTSAVIPDSVTYIGNHAFANNNITRAVVGNGVVFIGSNSFCGDSYEENKITEITLGAGIKYIGPNAFRFHYATSVVIPKNVAFIGYNAFRPENENSLVNITIGKYVMFGVNNDEGAFHNNADFDTIYQNNDKKAGKYTYADGSWSYKE
jgi:hypothetical protein